MYIINDPCIACANCQLHCPEKAIEYNPKKGIYAINDKCTDCGICVEYCPVKAIKPGGENNG
jgi:NAD-dependent dihydropyrimidine dehydrogenase PreA subunit